MKYSKKKTKPTKKTNQKIKMLKMQNGSEKMYM